MDKLLLNKHILKMYCSLIFFGHVLFIGLNNLNPDETTTRFEAKKLDDIEFPVIFRICIYASFNNDKLRQAGYKSSWTYFIGQSIYNKNVYGWGGHYNDTSNSLQNNKSVRGKNSESVVCYSSGV